MISFKVNAVGQYKTVEYNDGTKIFYIPTEKVEEVFGLIYDITSARDFAQSSWILGAFLATPSLISSELLSRLFPKLKNWNFVIGLSGPAMLAVLPRLVNYFREEANRFADLAKQALHYYIGFKGINVKDYFSFKKFVNELVKDIEKGNGMAFALFPTKKSPTYYQDLNDDLVNLVYQGFTMQSSMSERYEKDLEEHCGGIKKVYDNEIHFN